MATLRTAIDARGATRGAAEFDRATGKMKRSAGTATKSIESGFASAMRRILMFGGAGGAIYTLKKFIDSASDAQETMNKFNVVFKDNSKEAAAWSEQFGDSVGRATQDVQKWMAGLQDLFVPLGFARKEAMGLSMDLTKLAVDVASFNNQADADVIRDFTSALVGNHETVRKYGIIISETSLAQEALNQNLGKTYKDLTDLEKVQLRMSLIQRGTTDAQGDAIRSSDDYANQVKRLNANWIELKTTLGGPAMRALSEIIGATNEAAQATKNWIEVNKEMPPGPSQLPPGSTERMRAMYSSLGFSEYGGRSPFVAGPETMGQLPAESEEAALNKRLQELGSAEFAEPPLVNKEIAAAEKAAADLAERRLDITARMYEDMGQFDAGYNQSHVALLDQQKADYGQYVDDKLLLDKWYGSELEKIQEQTRISNLDAMGLYQEELRADMEDTAAYTAEKFAEASRSSRNSLSDAFYDMMAEGESFEDAMDRFFENVGRSFARMVSDMMADWLMLQALETLNIGGGGGGNTAGAITAAGTTAATAIGTAGTGMSTAIEFAGGQVSMAINAAGAQAAAAIAAAGATSSIGGAAGSAYGNVFDRGRIVPMASGDIFDRPTYFPLAGGNTGLMGEAGPEGVMPLRRGRGGRLGVDASGGTPNITVSPTPVKVVFVSNAREAAIEAMKSKEGEKVHIQHAMRNQNLLR